MVKIEHHAQSVDDALVGGLSYKLKPGASYVTNRRPVTYFAQGGNQYSSSGVNVMHFHLTGDQWLDPSTFRIVFQINNTSGSGLVRPMHWNPAVLFRRARLICGGQVLEDIDEFSRLSIMMTALKSKEEQLEIAIEGFGSFNDHYEVDGGIVPLSTEDDDERNVYRVEDADRSGHIKIARKAMFKPMFGLLQQDKFVPLRYCSIQLELGLVSSAADAVFYWCLSECNLQQHVGYL